MNLAIKIALVIAVLVSVATVLRFSALVYVWAARRPPHHSLMRRLAGIPNGKRRWKRFLIVYLFVAGLAVVDACVLVTVVTGHFAVDSTLFRSLVCLAPALSTFVPSVWCNILGAELKTIRSAWFLARPGVHQ